MARKQGFYVFAMLVYLVAWFMPVIKGGSTLFDGKLPGFEALMIALGPITELGGDSGLVRPILSVLSGASNAVFLTALVLLARRPPRAVVAVARSLGVAAVVNTYWQFEVGFNNELRIGYYMWFGSFAMLALHARALAAGAPAREPASVAPPVPAA